MQPAGLRSIRWQLPLTYAAIALVAAVALSALLIGILRQYYALQEYDLLDSSSRGLARYLSVRMDTPMSDETLPALIEGLRFVPDYRVEMLDPNGEQVFDTGVMDTFQVRFAGPDEEGNVLPLQPIGPQEADAPSLLDFSAAVPAEGIILSVDGEAPVITFSDAVGAAGGGGMITGERLRPIIWQLIDGGKFNDLMFNSAPIEQPDLFQRVRSNASVTQMVTSSRSGDVIGFVRLSNPPAIASSLIESVTSGAIVAGIGAVLIAGFLGWWVSLRLTRPLLALTDATARMTRGDLSVRVDVPRRDELGALAESFNAMAGKVEQTVAVLRRFAADAAHELHTPLTAIKTNLELTQERPEQARLIEAVEQIARLEALADDLLDLSRLEVAETPRREPVDVGALVREVSEVYASRAEQAGVEFALRLGDTPPHVRANATLLRRALSNLLDNAVKFTPSGGDVSLATSAGDGALEFVVEDSGIGIPSDDLPALFSRFHRGSNTSGYPGSGLGLAIVKAIADVHHGTVLAENTARGARFVLKLPAAGA